MKGRTKLGTAAVAVAVPLTIIALVHGCDPPPLGAKKGGDVEATQRYFGAKCGVERWPEKVLSDPDAGLVNLTPVPSTIPKLAAIPTPKTLPQDARVKPDELVTYQLRSTILQQFKVEGDSDIHLVLRSTIDGETLIAEIPNPGCVPGGSRGFAQITAARAAFVSLFGQPSTSWTHVNKRVTITGVFFHDFAHGQTGISKNAAELHPVLSIR